MIRCIKQGTIILALMSLVLPVIGQLNPFETGGAEAPLVESSPTGGLDASEYTGQAESAAGRGTQPGVSFPVSPEAAEFGGPMDPEMMMYNAQFRREMMGAPQQQLLPTPTPFIRMIRVVTGRRVKCAVCGRLLEDIRYEEVPETLKDQYYDDGTHGDEVANDGTYTNIEEISDVVGPGCLAIETRLINLLLTSEELGPLGFFRLFTLTDEPISNIPKRINTEEDLDNKLESWANVFLRMFRKNKDDIYSEFYSLYVPPPPVKPKFPLPPGFNPPEIDKMKEEMEAQERERAVGEPMGGASSRYYEGGMMMGI